MNNNPWEKANQRIEEDSEYKDIKKSVKSEREGERFFVFASIDMCNSTELKSIYDFWYNIVGIFLESTDLMKLMKPWKFSGDEIIFCAEITSVIEIVNILNDVYEGVEVLTETIRQTIQQTNILQSILSDDKIKEILYKIDFKTTVWFASVKETSDLRQPHRHNLNYMLPIAGRKDFVGTSIDEGFRLCGAAIRNKIVVDPKIAFLICVADNYVKNMDNHNEALEETKELCDLFGENLDDEYKKLSLNQKIELSECCKKLYMIDFCQSKGIWRNRLYPVVWYIKDKEKSLENTYYDEIFNLKYIVHILKDIDEDKYSISRILEIFDQVRVLDVAKKVAKNIHLLPRVVAQQTSVTRMLEGNTNLYYMVVCVNTNTNKVLIFRRSKKRRHLKNVWDFGSVKHTNALWEFSKEKSPLISGIAYSYEYLFDLKVELVIDEERKSIKPFAFCSLPRYGKFHNAILCYARINEKLPEMEIENKVNSRLKILTEGQPDLYKYTEARFVDLDVLAKEGFSDLGIDEVLEDSVKAYSDSAPEHEGNKCINNMSTSIKEALNFFRTEGEKEG